MKTKKKTEKKMADEKCYKLGTGGGHYKMTLNFFMIVRRIITQCMKSEDIFIWVYSDEARKENITEETNEVQWAKYTPDMLKKKEAKAPTQARTNNENQISTKISQWASVKAALEEEKKKVLDEEYKTKIQLLRERQQVEIDILKKNLM
ncbi:hypothetical protein JTB14_027571 [Gonioctena quinquepunctata]|nr:hypothetical protein JTB14_027571 [Gonioctena quinquepunctata]